MLGQRLLGELLGKRVGGALGGYGSCAESGLAEQSAEGCAAGLHFRAGAAVIRGLSDARD